MPAVSNGFEEPIFQGLRKLVRLIGEIEVVVRLKDAVKAQAAVERLNIHKYLEKHNVRGLYWRALDVGEGRIKDLRLLARLLLRLNLPVQFVSPPEPWNRIQPNSVIALVVGERKVEIPAVAENMKQRAVGARDVEALILLVKMWEGELSLDARVEVLKVASDLPGVEAEEVLATLCKRCRGGAVIVLGSPVVNSLADPVARRMMGDDEGLLPAKFRWSFTGRKRGLRDHEPFLSSPLKYEAEREGIAHREHLQTTFPRIRDDVVMASVAAHKNGSRRPRGRFGDCGMLMLDCRTRGGPLLGLLAGHGGCGTIASVFALRDYQAIAGLLRDSRDARTTAVGEDRVFGVVEVERQKPTWEPVDDMTIARWRWGLGHRSGSGNNWRRP